RVRVELHSTPVVLGYFQVDQRGVGTTTVTVPAATSPGRHHIWVIGEDSGLQFAKTVTIVPAPEQPTVEVLGTTRPQVAAAAAGGRLSSTGVGAGTMSAAWIGTIVLLGGIGLVAATTRSRRHQPRH